MKRANFFTLLGMAVLFLSLMSISLYAQDPSASPQSQATQPPSQGQQQSQTFSGKITKAKGDLVLRDETSGTTYKLDNPDQAKQWVGKNVKVTGTLDPATNTIHITNVELATTSS